MIRAPSSRYASVSITCAVSGGDVFKIMSPAEFRASLGPWRTSAPAPLADVESR